MCALIEHGNGGTSLLALDSSDMDAHRYSCTKNKTNTTQNKTTNKQGHSQWYCTLALGRQRKVWLCHENLSQKERERERKENPMSILTGSSLIIRVVTASRIYASLSLQC